jgi:hypothetical protein
MTSDDRAKQQHTTVRDGSPVSPPKQNEIEKPIKIGLKDRLRSRRERDW